MTFNIHNSISINNTETEIVILSNGFVYVGDHNPDTCEILFPLNIRHWGTENGVGELAFGGPREATKLDNCGHIIYNPAHLICTIKVEDGVFDEALDRKGREYTPFGDQFLVVAEAGFVFVGDCEQREASLKMTEASVVRSWSPSCGAMGGVSLGLGGVMDACGEVELPLRAVIHMMRCTKRIEGEDK